MLYKNRSKFQRYDERLGNILKKVGLTPNQWTIVSLVFSFASVYFLVNQAFLPAAIILAFAALFDSFDGAVARATGKANKKGAYYDTIADRYVEFFVIIGLMLATIPQFVLPGSFWLLLYLFGSFMTTYSKAAAKEKEISKIEIKGGILERAERMMLLFAGLLLASLSKTYLTYVIVLMAVLSNITAIQRINIAIKSSPKVDKA